MVEAVGPCPLCDGIGAEPIAETSYDTIWAEYRRRWGITFSQAVIAAHSPSTNATLYLCECGLEYFWPFNAGSDEFYSELTRQFPYEAERWEFDVSAALVPKGSSVVDFGAGGGAFLDLVRERSERAVGVDLSQTAINGLRNRGIEAHAVPFASFAEGEDAVFDVVCSFQVLEHLARAADLLEPMIRVANPGGRILISVPNRNRIGRLDPEPLDLPPHHLSRWSVKQIHKLGDLMGLETMEVATEPPLRDAARAELRDEIQRRLGGRKRTRQPQALVSRGIAKLFLGGRGYDIAVRRQWFQRVGWFGHSILAEYRVPVDPLPDARI